MRVGGWVGMEGRDYARIFLKIEYTGLVHHRGFVTASALVLMLPKDDRNL